MLERSKNRPPKPYPQKSDHGKLLQPTAHLPVSHHLHHSSSLILKYLRISLSQSIPLFPPALRKSSASYAAPAPPLMPLLSSTKIKEGYYSERRYLVSVRGIKSSVHSFLLISTTVNDEEVLEDLEAALDVFGEISSVQLLRVSFTVTVRQIFPIITSAYTFGVGIFSHSQRNAVWLSPSFYCSCPAIYSENNHFSTGLGNSTA